MDESVAFVAGVAVVAVVAVAAVAGVAVVAVVAVVAAGVAVVAVVAVVAAGVAVVAVVAVMTTLGGGSCCKSYFTTNGLNNRSLPRVGLTAIATSITVVEITDTIVSAVITQLHI